MAMLIPLDKLANKNVPPILDHDDDDDDEADTAPLLPNTPPTKDEIKPNVQNTLANPDAKAIVGKITFLSSL
jgi:hypothetical protein